MAKPTDEIKLPRYLIESIASLMENPENQSLELRKEATELRRSLATHESSTLRPRKISGELHCRPYAIQA